MKKRIISILNKEKSIWLSLEVTDSIVKDLDELINEIDKKYCLEGSKEWMEIVKEENEGKDISDFEYLLSPPKKLIGRIFEPFGNDSLIIIFCQNVVTLILNKNCQRHLFKRIERKIYDKFEIRGSKS